MAGPRAQLASGDYMEVNLASALTIGQARARIAAAQGVPLGRVRLLSKTTYAPLGDDQAIQDDMNVVLLTMDPEAERFAEAQLLRAAGAVNVEALTALQTLDLEGKQLTALPESFGQLTALQTVYLDENQLTALPESFFQLTALQNLGLSENQLTVLPESFGQLTALQNLGLSENQLTALPESFRQLAVAK